MMGLIPPIVYFRSVAKTLKLAVKTMAFMKPWVQKYVVLHIWQHLRAKLPCLRAAHGINDLSPNIFCTLTALLGNYIAMFWIISLAIIYITHLVFDKIG
jgi:hypothetical protein